MSWHKKRGSERGCVLFMIGGGPHIRRVLSPSRRMTCVFCSSSLKHSRFTSQASLLMTLLVLILSSAKTVINCFCSRHLQSSDRTVSPRGRSRSRENNAPCCFLTLSRRFATRAFWANGFQFNVPCQVA